MKKKGWVVLLLLGIAILSDATKEGIIKEGYIEREEMNGEEKKLQLQLEMEGIDKNYDYMLEVLPAVPTREEADILFEEAIKQIEKDFSKLEDVIPAEKEYLSDKVQAEWSFHPYGIISPEGEICIDKLEEETIVQAQVTLSCGDYEKIYTFSFEIEMPELSTKEQILLYVEDWLQQEMEKEGSNQIYLPTEAAGIHLVWSEEKEYVTPKVFLLVVISMLLLWMVEKRKIKEEEKKRIAIMEREYPDIVSQLALLVGAGMTTRQAWQRMAEQYNYKRNAQIMDEKPVYEALILMNRRLREGESERVVYQKFVEEIPVSCYRKLIRILLGNLEKGTKGLSTQLEEESRLAFEQKIMEAKKLGEEASTKMMFPLMLMLMIVMGMVMVPAIVGFQI